MKQLFALLLLITSVVAFAQTTDSQLLKIIPIKHASFVMQKEGLTLIVDPTGDAQKYSSFQNPDLILITHTHGDHFSPELISKLKSENTTVIGCKAAIDKLGFGSILLNEEKTQSKGVKIEAVACYNTNPERLQYHQRGEGNGYVLTIGNERIYISGDTEDIREMRILKNIDHAFVCMNLPYTMNPEQAASAVLEFQPKKVYPYHYSQQEGFSNIEKFKSLVAVNKNIEVVFLKWYD